MTNDQVIPPKRKHPRLKEFDYSQPGSYFVTICTKDRKHLFGTFPVGRGDLTPPHIKLSSIGLVASRFVESIGNNYQNVSVDKYVIMPNHIHLLLTLSELLTDPGNPADTLPSLHDVIRAFKSLVTKSIGHKIWQTSYYDHIIRDDADYQKVWEYIDANADKWHEDKYFSLTS